jgi:hypothetical protein
VTQRLFFPGKAAVLNDGRHQRPIAGREAAANPAASLRSLDMTFAAQIKTLERRLAMAVRHAVQAQGDLDAIRVRAGLEPARPVFFLSPAPKPPALRLVSVDPASERPEGL